MTDLRLVGRDFDGFRDAAARHAAGWPGDVSARWLGLRELQHLLLATPACRDGDVHLVVVPADWLPALAEAGAVRPLSALLARTAPQGWPDCWSPSFHDGLTYDDEIWGLPFHDGPQLLFTRTDLPGVEPARTWADLVATATTPTHDPDLFGTVLAGAPDGHNNVYDFVVQLWRHGGDVLGGGEVVLHSSAAAEALLFLREVLRPLGPPDAHGLDSVQSGQEYAAGRVVTMLSWAGFAVFGRDPASAVHGRTICSPAPAGPDGAPTTTVNAFWVTALTTGAADTGAAWDYLLHATSPAMDLETTRAGASGARFSTWDDPDVVVAAPEHALFREAHAHSRPLWRVPQLPSVVDVLSDLVDAVVWCDAAVEPALVAAHRAVSGLVGTPQRSAR